MQPTVFIGLDFGTTFTKIAFRLLPTVRGWLYRLPYSRERRDPFFPSELRFHPAGRNLSWTLGNHPGGDPVRYFKYALAFDSRNIGFQIAETMGLAVQEAAFHCSAFFLGCVLRSVRDRIMNWIHDEHKEIDAVRWAVNMGIPAKTIGNANLRDRYLRVLRTAWNMSFRDCCQCGVVPIGALPPVVSGSDGELHPDRAAYLNVFPELFAEILNCVQNPNMPNGLYTIIDVGGGTMDVATFKKSLNADRHSEVHCLAECVEPYGAEITKFPHADWTRPVRSAYGGCVTKARNRCGLNGIPYLANDLATGAIGHTWYLTGGGANADIYPKAIKYMADIHANYGLIRIQRCGKLTELTAENQFTGPDGGQPDRLIIAQTLAQPPDSIPDVGGFPHIPNPFPPAPDTSGDFEYLLTDT